ncbi:MAG: hypothetical protein DKM50_13565, partial [Candidatus Margulisiibacteriota bacterium]
LHLKLFNYSQSGRFILNRPDYSATLSRIILRNNTIMTTQIQKGVIPELQSLKNEIENLGRKLQDPATEMTQNVVKELEVALGNMINEFKTTMSGSTKSELENLTSLLCQAGGSLTDFPEKLQVMTNNLNENFTELQNVVQGIAKQTLLQSSESTDLMKKQTIEMSDAFKLKIEELQIGQELLVNKQTQNIQISDNLLNSFNTSIEKMNTLSQGISGTIEKTNSIQTELTSTANHLRLVSETVKNSTDSFKSVQLIFSEHVNQFLSKNKETITEIQNSLSQAQNVSTDYVEKFSIIENGLQSIFKQIQEGIIEYKNTVGSSMENYLNKYSESLTNTVEHLVSQTRSQEDIVEELTEQLSMLRERKL